MDSLDKCIHCHKCRKSCDFLSKYGIDICDTERLRELAYHCFLCGRCSEVCPVGIDGREIILGFRRERAASGERPAIEKTYKGLISEKRNYRYRNWRKASEGTVFFPGCNFPSLYPKTNAALSRLFADNGIGTVYECCGKPIAELGLQEDEDRIIAEIRRRLSESGVTEVVTACPNCRGFFGDRLGVEVRSVYTKLGELGLGNRIGEDVRLFIPCPDREAKIWVGELKPFINGEITISDAAQCCGLGGSAMTYEAEIADGFVDKLKDDIIRIVGNEDVAAGTVSTKGAKSTESAEGAEGTKGAGSAVRAYTYCASCMGRFRRRGPVSIDHILTRILGTNEQPDIRKSYVNRMLTKIR